MQELFDSPISLMEAGGISITHSGRPGSLIARTMVANPATGYSSSMQFIDPGKSRSSRLHGAGLRLGAVAGEEMTPVVTSRNISDRTTTLRGRIYYTTNDGKQGEMLLRAVRLNPGEIKAWEIREVSALRRAGIKSAGLEFDYDTQPGSVIVSASSVSSKGSQVFQVPMLDPSAQTSSTGVYPFYLDYGSTTMVYIKNTMDEEQKYIAHLNYEGGTYMIGVRSIVAGETAAIDIRSLRDNQVPDKEGRTIPLDIERGQVRWTIIQREGTDLLAMIGRAEQVYEGRAMSSTYACQNCCGDFTESTSITPSSVDVMVGDTVQLLAFESRSDCYGFTYPVPQSASWSSNNNSVATVSGGQITTLGAGEVTITATWNSFYSVAIQCAGGPGFLPGPEPIGPSVCCDSRSQLRFATATVQVRGCGDQRDSIIREYRQFNVSFIPICDEFTQTASSQHFSFAELNTGDYSWAIIRNSLLTGLECVRTNNGSVPLTINSAYRNPGRNNRIGGASQSRHMHGDAADIASNANTWTQLRNAGKSCNGCVEPQNLSGVGHVHVDWRGSCPSGW